MMPDKMPARWTGELLCEMHLHGITCKMLAEELGCHPKYLSHIMNGKKQPRGAEERCRAALQRLIDAKGNG